MVALKFIIKTTFAGNSAYNTERFYVRRYANSLTPIPRDGSIIEYVIVKGGEKNDIVSKMRSPSTEEEIDEDWYVKKGII